jgi:hypothetical protein
MPAVQRSRRLGSYRRAARTRSPSSPGAYQNIVPPIPAFNGPSMNTATIRISIWNEGGLPRGAVKRCVVSATTADAMITPAMNDAHKRRGATAPTVIERPTSSRNSPPTRISGNGCAPNNCAAPYPGWTPGRTNSLTHARHSPRRATVGSALDSLVRHRLPRCGPRKFS